MNKKFKGAITAAATAALLIGAAGTFALWFDSEALATNAESIATGDLTIGTDALGEWIWANVSYVDNANEIAVNDAWEGTHLVPGDAIAYEWDADEIENLSLIGDTLVAYLYLDGVQVLEEDLPDPLVLWVNGAPLISLENGSFVIADNLNEDTILGVPGDLVADVTLPEILIGFPINVVSGVHTPVSPGADGLGYGRNIGTTMPIDISGLELRLQQRVSSGAFGY